MRVDVQSAIVDRRVAAIGTFGMVVLVFALLTGLAAPPRAGVAVRSGAPPAPPVGACAVLQDTQLTIVGCAELHTSEVVYAVAGDDTTGRPAPSFSVCSDRASEYVGSPQSGDPRDRQSASWTLPLRYYSRVAAGPGATIYPGWTWRVCLVNPMGPGPWSGYRGSVRGGGSGDIRPPALRPCFDTANDLLTVVPCSTAHRGEIVGIALLHADRPDVAAADRLFDSCFDRSRGYTGVPDPTYSGQLQVTVLPSPTSPLRGPLTADTGAYYTSDPGDSWLVCALQSPVAANLHDSLSGWGQRPLPLG